MVMMNTEMPHLSWLVNNDENPWPHECQGRRSPHIENCLERKMPIYFLKYLRISRGLKKASK
jgi:hypothetical protein